MEELQRRVDGLKTLATSLARIYELESKAQPGLRQRFELQHLKLQIAEAYRMRLTLQDFSVEQSNPRAAAQFLTDWCETDWCEMVLASGLAPMARVARTLADHVPWVSCVGSGVAIPMASRRAPQSTGLSSSCTQGLIRFEPAPGSLTV